VGASVADFTLPRCDGTPFTFYDDAFCAPEHRATVLIFGALWCTRCQDESTRLDAEITQVYRDRGVRVVQVLVDGAIPGTNVTAADCSRWVATYGLTNDELYDAGGAVTAAFYATRTFPSTVLVDADGVIRYRSVGASDGLPALRDAIDGVIGP
jgi:peroxiredoxin